VSEIPEHVERAAGLEVHEAQDGLVVFDPTSDRVHHLNATAAVLFELCAAERSRSELATLIVDLYGLDEPPAAGIEAGLRQLLAEGILVGH
jgi:Coenzyme PQQ synthesis protein D (PqqD)